MSIYKTIAAPSEGFYKEKGSKFYAYAVPVTNEEEIKHHIQNWRKRNVGAVHVCSAFRIGFKQQVYRCSDDGEPSNSAGPPILGQIQSFELTNVLIGIVRFYGGTNLGVGGLINAYRTAAKDALEQAEIIEVEEQFYFELHFSYDLMPDVMSQIKKWDVQIIEQYFELDGKIKLQLSESKLGILEQFNELEKHLDSTSFLKCTVCN